MNKRKDTTAEGVAKQRLIESLAKSDKRVINDPYAKIFVKGAGIIKLMGHSLNVWLGQKLAPGFHEHVISRTRFVDDLIEKSAANEVEQYVILGAGYDSRPYRLNLPSSLEIFEVDQPEVQQKKLSKLPKELMNKEALNYVSVDFDHQSLSKQLIEAGFDQNKSTVFTLEGVSQYISKEALISMVKEVSSLMHKSNSTFFISYVDELLIKKPEACFGEGYPKPKNKAELIMNLTAKAGEPWISLYSPEEMGSLFLQNGFSVEEDLTLKDLNTLHFNPVGRALPENQIFNLERFLVAKSFN